MNPVKNTEKLQTIAREVQKLGQFKACGLVAVGQHGELAVVFASDNDVGEEERLKILAGVAEKFGAMAKEPKLMTLKKAEDPDYSGN